MRGNILKTAREAGFSDARIAEREGSSILLLFIDYTMPNCEPEHGRIGISNYYPVSHRGYIASRELKERLAAVGVGSAVFHKHGLKKLAVSTCGRIGRNTLFFHPEFGSYVCIQALVLDEHIEADSNVPEDTCGSCKACQRACPTGAITQNGFIAERCVRSHAKKHVIPEEFGRVIYQMMGCDICQQACPKNNTRYSPQYTFDIKEVLRGLHTKPLKKLIGPNLATRTAILNQTLFYTANKRYTEALPEVEALLGDEFVGIAANFAYKILIDASKYNC